MLKQTKLEICVDSVRSAIEAAKHGVDRVEVCSALEIGGVTASAGLLLQTVARLRDTATRVFALIRPRGGDFVYDEYERTAMVHDIRYAGKVGCDGVAVGALTVDGALDVAVMRLLVEEAHGCGMEVTLHRAFDMTVDAMACLRVCRDLGVSRVLTSGQAGSALEGAPVLARLVQVCHSGDASEAEGHASEQATGKPCGEGRGPLRPATGWPIIVAAGGVSETNIDRIAKQTRACEFHGSARKRYQSPATFRRTSVHMSAAVYSSEFECAVASGERITAMLQTLDGKRPA